MVRNLIIIIVIILSCNNRKVLDQSLTVNNMIQVKDIKTNGYYYATYSLDINSENDFFENKAIILLKFDKDGYCNVFDIPISKSKTFKETIIYIKQRNYSNSPENSGIYYIENNKLIIKYSIFNNPNHLLGKYKFIYYKGSVVNEKRIQFQTNHGNLEFEFIEDESFLFRNYFRENNKQ